MNLQLLTRRIRVNSENAIKALEIANISMKQKIALAEKLTEELKRMNTRLRMRVVK